MVRSTQDYSVFAGNGGASFSAEDGQPIEIEDRVFTWFTMDDFGSCLIYYEMTLKNPQSHQRHPQCSDPGHGLRRERIRTSTPGAHGLMIAAGDTIMFGDAFSYQGPAPASVEWSLSRARRLCQPGGIVRTEPERPGGLQWFGT